MLSRSVLLLAIPTFALQAQAPAGKWWLPRPGVVLTGGIFMPRTTGHAFDMMAANLTLDQSDMQPRLRGGQASLLFGDRVAIVFGLESGARAVSTVSTVQPAGDPTPVPQRTSLKFTPLRNVGVEWHAWRWRAASSGEPDNARLVIGAGAGEVAYTLRQWGAFVDVARQLRFSADFTSSAIAQFGYVSVGGEFPITQSVGFRTAVRQQFGGAPESSTLNAFESFDLSGTHLSLGLYIRAAGRSPRR